MNNVYQMARDFKKKFPGTISWRLKAHCKIINLHLNEGEKVYYAFGAQKGGISHSIFNTLLVALSNRRILIGQKGWPFGYYFTAITPFMFNDIKVKMGIIWGEIIIDTVKEKVFLSYISKKALPEIETKITEYMMKEKEKYGLGGEHNLEIVKDD